MRDGGWQRTLAGQCRAQSGRNGEASRTERAFQFANELFSPGNASTLRGLPEVGNVWEVAARMDVARMLANYFYLASEFTFHWGAKPWEVLKSCVAAGTAAITCKKTAQFRMTACVQEIGNAVLCPRACCYQQIELVSACFASKPSASKIPRYGRHASVCDGRHGCLMGSFSEWLVGT